MRITKVRKVTFTPEIVDWVQRFRSFENDKVWVDEESAAAVVPFIIGDMIDDNFTERLVGEGALKTVGVMTTLTLLGALGISPTVVTACVLASASFMTDRSAIMLAVYIRQRMNELNLVKFDMLELFEIFPKGLPSRAWHEKMWEDSETHGKLLTGNIYRGVYGEEIEVDLTFGQSAQRGPKGRMVH